MMIFAKYYYLIFAGFDFLHKGRMYTRKRHLYISSGRILCICPVMVQQESRHQYCKTLTDYFL